MNPSRRLQEFQVAAMLLSRLPAGRISGTAPDMAASVWAWPVIGAGLGLLAGLVFAVAHALGLPPLLASLLAFVTLSLATGALHEDGLADLADGFWGGADRARKLEIMRDSRIGTYGVLALVFSVSLRVGAVAHLADPWHVMAGFVAVAALSRMAMAVWLWWLPAARKDGLGQAAGGVPGAALLAAIGFAQPAPLFLLGVGSWLTLVAATFAGSALIAALAMRHIGGQTGDVLGAAQHMAEIFGWLALVVLFAAAAV